MGNVSSSPAAAAPLLQAAADTANRQPAPAPASVSQSSNAAGTDSSAPASTQTGSTGQNASIAGIGLSPEAAAAAAAAAAADGTTATAPSTVDASKSNGRQRKRMLQLEAKLQVYMDSEDRRVKELTEGVLYELLPAALNVMLPSCEDPLTELDPERCRAVAGAALAASALMNAPPGFLEFLLCIPWRRLPQLYPSTAAGTAAASGQSSSTGTANEQQKQQQPGQQDLLAESAADEAERRLLVNLPLHPELVRPVLQFMYKPQHADSVPPILRPTEQWQHTSKQPQHGSDQQPGTSSSACTADGVLMSVAEALLDGATPFHCAALRGNPAQVDHLLYCGADPTRRTAAGDLPLQLVPKCGGYDKVSRTQMCTCLGPAEQEVWECRSRIARTLIASKCLTAFRVGLLQYLSLLWMCFMAFLGLNTGARAALLRLLAHMHRREEQQQQEALERTCAAVDAMRQEASLGQAHLTLAKQQIGSRHLAAQQRGSRGPPSSSDGSAGSWAGGTTTTAAAAPAESPPGAAVPDSAGSSFGLLVFDMETVVGAAAAPRPVATGPPAPQWAPAGMAANAAGPAGAAIAANAAAAAASGQEPVAPGTPSASEEAAAAYSAAAKCRRSGSGSLRWSAAAGAAQQQDQLTEQQSDSSTSSSASSSASSSTSSRAASRNIDSINADSNASHTGHSDAQEASSPCRDTAHNQHLLRQLLSAANTTAADASPTVAAAAALAAGAEHAWQDHCGCLPLTAQAQNGFSEVAFKCFVRAVHALQRLNLQEDGTPQAVCRADNADLGAAAAAPTSGSDSPAATSTSAAGSVGVTATSLAKLKAAAVAAGIAGPLPNGLAAAMSLDAVGSSPRTGTLATAAAKADGSPTAFAQPGTPVQQGEQQQLCVPEDEQANLYCCWAESVLLKHNACACAGCTALAVHAIRMAHIAVVRLFNRVHKERLRWPLRWRAVGRALSRIVYVHIALICRTEAAASPSKASVWRALQCLQEWDKLLGAGLAGGGDQEEAAAALTAGSTVQDVVDWLRMWAKAAESDLIIAEALLGSSLSNLTTLDEALAAAFVTPVPPTRGSSLPGSGPSSAGGSSTSCLPVLVRPVSTALLNQLQTARGLAVCPSPVVKHLAAQVADTTAAELSAGARLREQLAGRIPPSTQEGVAALAAAITAAEPFSSLAPDVEAARALHQQSCARAEVAARLQAVVDKVHRLSSRVAVLPSSSSNSGGGAGPTGSSSTARSSSGGGSSISGEEGSAAACVLGLPLQGFSMADWQQYVGMLEAAVEPAKDANVSVTKARKLVKELQAQMTAAEAAAQLDSCMSRRPCGSNALKAAISKGEAAASAVSGTATTTTGVSAAAGSAGGPGGAAAAAGGGPGSSSCVFSELLVVRLQAAKKRLEVEKAAEALHKASVTYKNVTDLPKLETAVLNARKVGAEELAPDEYKAASELRARLTGALRVKQQLEAALKGLATTSLGRGPRGRQLEQLAEPVEAAIKEVARCEDLLPGEAARATELLEAWRTSSACEAKLSRALRDGCSAAMLSRIISEAAAAGVKVTSAKRVLKLQQVLEAAVAMASESAASAAAGVGHGQLVSKLEAAEAGGVAPSVLQPGRQLLRKLLAVEARQALEAALKPHSDWSANERIATLRAALDKAEEAMGCSVQELEEQQQQQQPDRHPGADVPQQQDQQQRATADDSTDAHTSASTANAVDHTKQQQQQRRPGGSAACSSSTAASTCSKNVQQQQQQLARTDSVASSSACSESSSLAPSSTAGGAGSMVSDIHGSCRQQPSAVEAEVLLGLQELSLRAWQLLQQDQQQLEERERERLEQERERRERERKERQRAEAERAERGRAEREKAAQERKAARAKAAAERAKAFTVVFGSSAGGLAFGNSMGSGAARSNSKRDAARHSADSAGGGVHSDTDKPAASAAEADAGSTSIPQVATVDAGKAAAAAGAGDRRQASAAAPTPAKQWGPSKQQQQRKQAASTGAHGEANAAQASHHATAAAASDPAMHAAWSPGAASIGAVSVTHARCDSFDILGDEHSKLGRDMLALLESPEDATPGSSSAAAAAATQQQQQQQQPTPAQQQQPQQQQHLHQASQQSSLSVDASMPTAGPGAGDTECSQQAGSHPATPRLNLSLVDLGGASWGTEATEGRVPINQQVRPASAGGCIMSLSPGAAAVARATAAMDSSRHSLELQGAAGSNNSQTIWRSPLGLGIDGPSLPPLAPRGQQLPLRHSTSHNSRSLTDDGAGSTALSGLSSLRQRQQQQLQLAQGANSFDPIASPAGRISPVGTAVTTLGAGQVPQPAFLYRQQGSNSTMGLSSPRSYPQLQQALPSLLQHQTAAHSSSVGGSPLLSQYEDCGGSRTAAAISCMEGGTQPWMLQQQAQQQQQQQHAPGARLVVGADGPGSFTSMPLPSPSLGPQDPLLFEQQLQVQQQQYRLQSMEQQGAGHLGFPAEDLAGTASSLVAALLPVPSSAPLAAAVSSGLSCHSPAPLVPQVGVGALSSSFAFGAPYSSSFSPAPLHYSSSSLGGAAGAADGFGQRGTAAGLRAPRGAGKLSSTAFSTVGPAGRGGVGFEAGSCMQGLEAGTGGGGSESCNVTRPEDLLPDDLNISPPSSQPARWLQE